jgi:hypothetical protein
MPRPRLDDDVLFVRQRPFEDDNRRTADAHAHGRPVYLAVCVHAAEPPTLSRYDLASRSTKPVEE